MTYVKMIRGNNFYAIDLEINQFVRNKKVINVNVVPYIQHGDVTTSYLATICYEVL